MQGPDQNLPPWSAPVRISDLRSDRPVEFACAPDAAQRRQLCDLLGISDLRKLRFAGQIVAAGQSDWRISGTLGATVVQPCVVTLEPVTTRIDEPVVRYFTNGLAEPDPGSETEIPSDETREPLGAFVDPGRVMVEALALAIPAYPRAEGANLAERQFSGPGKEPMSDEKARPFAGLADMRRKLSGSEPE